MSKGCATVKQIASNRNETSVPVAPGRLPWLGNSLQLKKDTCQFFVDQYMRHGPVYQFSIPGRTYIALAGLEANQFLMKNEYRYFSSKMTYPLITQELQTDHYLNAMDGTEHQAYRKVVRPLLLPDLLNERVLEQMQQAVELAADKWCRLGHISVLKEMQQLFLDIVGIAVAGKPAGAYYRMFNRFTNTFITTGAQIKPKFFLKSPSYVRAKREMRNFLSELLEDVHHEETMIARIKALKLPGGSAADAYDRLAMSMVPYLNSTLYVGRIATTMLYHWLEQPERMESARQDKDGQYVMGSLYESLRLVPMAVAHPRTVIEPFEFAGYTFERGNNVMFAVSVTHFLQEHFPDPEQFLPVRWIRTKGHAYRPPRFTAFGLGPHACMGSRLVEQFIGFVMPMLLERITFQQDTNRAQQIWTVDPVPGPSEKWSVQVSTFC